MTRAGFREASTDTELGYVFLYVALMLLVLTLTSIWMDMETYREGRVGPPPQSNAFRRRSSTVSTSAGITPSGDGL